MLIQQVAGALGVQLVQNAFGFGSAKPRPVGFGLFFRLMSFGALLETFQVDHIPHACPHHATIEGHATFSPRRSLSRWASEHFPVEWSPVGRKNMLSIGNVAAGAKPASAFAKDALVGSVVITNSL